MIKAVLSSDVFLNPPASSLEIGPDISTGVKGAVCAYEVEDVIKTAPTAAVFSNANLRIILILKLIKKKDT